MYSLLNNMKNVLKKLFSPDLDIEVIDTYFHKLPDRISVSWKREDGFIVGEISFNGYDPIHTQARNPKEFVRMVNDAVYIAFDLKPEYIDFFHRQKDFYAPKIEQWKELNNGEITESSFGVASRISRESVCA